MSRLRYNNVGDVLSATEAALPVAFAGDEPPL